MEIFLFWVLFAIVVGVIASSRGLSGFGWFLLSIVISPLLGVLLVALMPSLKPLAPMPTEQSAGAAEAWRTRSCPFCAETIKVEAIKCKHCGSTVEPLAASPAVKDYETN